MDQNKTLAHAMAVLNWVTGAVLFALMSVTVVDVTGRYFFDKPLGGAFELTEVMLALVVSMALPAVTAAREHVQVDLLDRFFSPAVLRWRNVVSNLVCAATLLVLAYGVGLQAKEAADAKLSTLILEIPLAPFVYLAAASAGVCGLLFAAQAVVRPLPHPGTRT